MVAASKKNERSLWLLARRSQWNRQDKRGTRAYNCQVCQVNEGYAEIHGCRKERATGPRKLGPYDLTRCPNYYLRRHDPLRDEVIKVFQDYKAGTAPGWPDAYAGAVADGVRLVDREINECEAEMIQQQRQQGGN